MARIQVLVAATSPDIEAEGIAAAVENCVDMALVAGRAVPIADIEALLAAIPRDPPRVLVLVGPDHETEFAERRLTGRVGLVVIRVGTPFGNLVRTAFNDIGLQNLLDQIRVLAEPHGVAPADVAPLGEDATMPADGPLLRAGIAWLHATLRHAASNVGAAHGDLPGLTVAPARVVEQLDDATSPPDDALTEANTALDKALAAAHARDEPLAAVVSAMELTDLELRVLLLALAPELDPRYQRCIGVLLDDLGRRVGTLGLCAGLLGDPVDVRFQLEATGNLARWRVFDMPGALLPPADEPLRLDPSLVAWILGDDDALLRDARIRRLFRLAPWPGAALIDSETLRAHAAAVVRQLATAAQSQWLLLAGDDGAGWQALLELGAQAQQSELLRLEGTRIAALDANDLEDTGIRIGRAALLADRPLVVDLTHVDADSDDTLRRALAAIGRTGAHAGVIHADASRLARLLGAMPFDRLPAPPLSAATHVDALREAAHTAGLTLSEAQAAHATRRFALSIAGIDEAMRLASSTATGTPEQRLDHFLLACKQVASGGISRLVERIEPVFSLDDVILPKDRKDQLDEIVDNVLLSDRVLTDWSFGDQLPYGRGVTALFHGPSGTGKTMAALAVARKLGIQILRIDLSRVVSKYIGDTEKNIDRVFEDAQRSGSALLIDEADALLGKRSEVKDAHDRYANIEVAYLLQRMEAYEGLAILTTNLRQNLDAAFLRRLRFIIDFPRPDAEARDRIWRSCLPAKARGALDDAAFRLLGRRIDLTGGHIRQITLRAAFIAAAADKKIDLSHIARATNAEFAKLGMPPVQLDTDVRKVA
ncbi:ATPase AAA [Lysobacter helvus]|uniref:ATPase AAA n=2 Tax=Lysobacteraceae TaxID=32033 RepID=A0ABM7Q1E3_9GAMM|nr:MULTISPECIES: ATP-binding protein [Lysobacter]BCT91029.1 ATPase AAA [Lysobacter caseinilyticus]BCT94182.1 ATPase AAA [Lysobacter helvus]